MEKKARQLRVEIFSVNEIYEYYLDCSLNHHTEHELYTLLGVGHFANIFNDNDTELERAGKI